MKKRNKKERTLSRGVRRFVVATFAPGPPSVTHTPWLSAGTASNGGCSAILACSYEADHMGRVT